MFPCSLNCVTTSLARRPAARGEDQVPPIYALYKNPHPSAVSFWSSSKPCEWCKATDSPLISQMIKLKLKWKVLRFWRENCLNSCHSLYEDWNHLLSQQHFLNTYHVLGIKLVPDLDILERDFLKIMVFWRVYNSEQGLTNYRQWAKFGPMPVLLNQVLLKHSHAQSFTYYLWQQSSVVVNRSCRAHKTENIYCLSL